jgi:hypothetical protein
MHPLYLAEEWRRTNPDLAVYVPKAYEGPDASNMVINAVATAAGTFLAVWTMARYEDAPDQHLVYSRSLDRGRTWSSPSWLDGPDAGERSGKGVASWAFLVLAPGLASGADRVYCFYIKNIGVNDARMCDTGAMRCRFTDDDGLTWIQPRDYPIGRNALSHPDPAVPPVWTVYQNPIVTGEGHVLAGFGRWASNAVDVTAQAIGGKAGLGMYDRWSEVSFLRFENILTETDPDRLVVTTWPKGAHGLSVPSPFRPGVSVAQEPTMQLLSDGRMICIMRTLQGLIYFALSEDDGRSWDQPRPLRYEPGGNPILNPIAPCPLYKLRDGRFLLLYYHNDGTANCGKGPTDSKVNRYPAWITVGREIPGEQDHPIRFGPPKIMCSTDGVLIPGTPGTQAAAYGSLVEDGDDRIMFYPDRKHFLLGRYLSDAWLADCDPDVNRIHMRPPTSIYALHGKI